MSRQKPILCREDGFSLVLAIFIVVVLAALGVYMVTLSGVQAFTPAFAIQGAQAYQAADSGIEWGIYEAITPPGTCATFPPPAGKVLTLGDFKVTVTCSATPFSEGGSAFNFYKITALAQTGTYGQPDYISRQVDTKVTNRQ